MDFQSEKLPIKPLIGGVISFVAMTLILTFAIDAIGLERIQEIITQAGPWAPLIYILIRALTFIAAPLSSGPIQFAAGILFGLMPGTLYSIIGETLGGSANFWISRLLGRPVVRRLVGESGMQRIDQFYEQIGKAWTLVYARLFLFAIYDFVSYAAGFTPIRYYQYALITAVVGIVPTFAAVYVGTQLTGDRSELIVLYALLGILCVIPLLFYKRIRKLLGLNRNQSVSQTPAEG